MTLVNRRRFLYQGSSTVELIRICAKALSRGGDEKSGCYQPWKTYIEGKGDSVKFVSFRGNRFNILFYLAQVLYYYWDSAKEFFHEVYGTPNRSLQAITLHMKNPIHK